MDSIETVIAEITKISPKVAALSQEAASAFRDETIAEATVLERIVGIVRPNLPAISSVIQSEETLSYRGSGGTLPTTKRAFFSERGVCVHDGGPCKDVPRADAGAYEGESLFLLTDGTFAQVTYSGRWSRWQGAGEQWQASPPRRMSLAEVASEYEIEGILSTLRKRLHEYAEGKISVRADQARTRAARLMAMLNLMLSFEPPPR